MNLKELTEKAEIEYAPTPPSGRGEKSSLIKKENILKNIKNISLRKPFAMIVGSVATEGFSNNDIDIVVRGEDLSDKVKEAVDFRIYRLFTHILGCEYDDIKKYVHIHYNNTGSYTSYIPIFELNLVPIENMDVINMSRNIKLNLKGNLRVINKANSKRRIIAGYANVAIIDKDNQFISTEVLKKGLKTLLDDPHYANLMLVHQNVQIGKILEGFGKYKTHVDDKGLFVVAEVRKDIKTADEVWEEILNKNISGFSIGCEVLLSHEECDDKTCVEHLDEINIVEVSVCNEPVNPKSGFIVISKCKEENKSVCCMSNELDTMKEEENEEIEEQKEKTSEEEIDEEETEETESEVQELSVEERLENIEKTIESLVELVQQTVQKEEPEEEEMPEEEPMEEEEEEEKMEEDEEEDEEEEEEPSKYPYPDSKAIESLQNSIDNLLKEITKTKEIDELKASLKAKDDAINSLEQKVELLNKSSDEEEKEEPKPKTVNKSEDEEEELEKESPIVVERGIVTSRAFM